MSKEKAIQIIENLFPTDSTWQDTSYIGEHLLQKARNEVIGNWRNESEEVLIRYAELCILEKNDQQARAIRKDNMQR
ncbi:MAG: hypothetical protein V4525_07955 [Pseudomonadota bacterium]